MEIEAKEALAGGGWLLSFGGLIAWVKIRIGDHKAKIERLEEQREKDKREISNQIDARFSKIEALFFYQDGEPRIMTVPAHEKLCSHQQEHWRQVREDQAKIFDSLEQQGKMLARIDEKMK